MLVGLLMVVAGAGPAEDDWDLVLLRQRVKRHIAKRVKRRARVSAARLTRRARPRKGPPSPRGGLEPAPLLRQLP